MEVCAKGSGPPLWRPLRQQYKGHWPQHILMQQNLKSNSVAVGCFLTLGKGQRWQFFTFWQSTTVLGSKLLSLWVLFIYLSPNLCLFVMTIRYLYSLLESYSIVQCYVLTNKDISKWCRKKFEMIILEFVKLLIQVWTSFCTQPAMWITSFLLHSLSNS